MTGQAMLDRTPDTTKDTRRRRYKRRQADGRICLKVEVHEHALAATFTRSGRLTPDQALHRAELEKAVSQLLQDFVVRWGGVTRPLE